jgi:hypothetical protein
MGVVVVVSEEVAIVLVGRLVMGLVAVVSEVQM